jgi:hypothetical protein
LLLTLLAVSSLAACASSSNIRSTYDDSMDFGQYRTYDFMEGVGGDSAGYQSLFTKYMIEAISKEMGQRGYTRSDNPDLLVNFNANFKDKTKVTTTPAPMHGGAYYGYRRGYYSAWPAYGYATETHVSQYTEGTFNIDLVDARKKQLVWEAVGIGRVTEKKLGNLEQEIREGVPKYFEDYPFRAGQGM